MEITNLGRKIKSGLMTTEGETNVKRIRVVIAEDQQNIRKDLRLLIASESDMEIVGEVNNGFDALDMVGSLHPDILILGLNS